MTDKIQLEGFRVVGIEAMVSPMGSPGFDPEAIPTLWVKLMENSDLSPYFDGPMYGVGVMDSDTGKMRYVAGFASNAEFPGTASIDVPDGAYFVVTHKGPLDGLGQTLGQFFRETVPAEGLHLGDGPFVEVYGEEFIPNSPDSSFDTLFSAS
ncbi:MAG: GyrI-like domain-containing protein [Actinomycetales bacterium]|nr:GyrI-like domain-containing protein [Actinomycetales bacterium]